MPVSMPELHAPAEALRQEADRRRGGCTRLAFLRAQLQMVRYQVVQEAQIEAGLGRPRALLHGCRSAQLSKPSPTPLQACCRSRPALRDQTHPSTRPPQPAAPDLQPAAGNTPSWALLRPCERHQPATAPLRYHQDVGGAGARDQPRGVPGAAITGAGCPVAAGSRGCSSAARSDRPGACRWRACCSQSQGTRSMQAFTRASQRWGRPCTCRALHRCSRLTGAAAGHRAHPEPVARGAAERCRGRCVTLLASCCALPPAAQAQRGLPGAGPSSRPKAVVTTAPQLQLPSILPLQARACVNSLHQRWDAARRRPPRRQAGAPTHSPKALGEG